MLNKNTLEIIFFDEFTYFYSKNRQLQMISYFKHIDFKEMHVISGLNHHANRLQVGSVTMIMTFIQVEKNVQSMFSVLS